MAVCYAEMKVNEPGEVGMIPKNSGSGHPDASSRMGSIHFFSCIMTTVGITAVGCKKEQIAME
jgi:hypothetical protein